MSGAYSEKYKATGCSKGLFLIAIDTTSIVSDLVRTGSYLCSFLFHILKSNKHENRTYKQLLKLDTSIAIAPYLASLFEAGIREKTY